MSFLPTTTSHHRPDHRGVYHYELMEIGGIETYVPVNCAPYVPKPNTYEVEFFNQGGVRCKTLRKIS